MKNFGFTLIALVLLSFAASAQFRNNVNQSPRAKQTRDNNSRELPKIYFGGGGGLGFGTGYTYYSLTPLVGYRVTDDFSVGTAITYQHYGYNQGYYGGSSYTQYGVMPFARYNFNPLFVQTELDIINAQDYVNATSPSDLERKNFARFLVGLGYMSQIGSGRSAFNILGMYDLLYKTPSIFQSPIVIRLFVTF